MQTGLPVLFIYTANRWGKHAATYSASSSPCHSFPPHPYFHSLFFPTFFLSYGSVLHQGSTNNPHSFGWLSMLRALSFWDFEFFYATLWYLWWWSPGWWLDEWVEEFHSVQQGYPSLAKQAAFRYPSKAMLSINFNVKSWLVHQLDAIHSESVINRKLVCSLGILLPNSRLFCFPSV